MTSSAIPVLRYESDKRYEPANWSWYGSDGSEIGIDADWGTLEQQPDAGLDAVSVQAAPDEKQKIDEAIERSKKILALVEDWDDEGAPGYSPETWDRATNFLQRHAAYTQETGSDAVDVPLISPADGGSIDLYWRMLNRSLLINFPAVKDCLPSYYGEDNQGDTIGGFISSETIREDLIAWVTRSL